MAAPTFVAEYESSWADTGTTRTVSVTRNSGDRLIALASTSDNGATLATPTLSGVTWTLATSRGGANNTWVYVWTGTATTSTTSDLSITRSGTTQLYGVNVFRFTASDGFGNAASGGADSGAPSQALTTTQADSSVCSISADWNAVDGTSRTARTVSGATYTERTYARNASYATVYAGTWEGVGAAGSKTVGWSAPTGQDYSIAAVEILGTASGTPGTFTANAGDAAADGGSTTFTGAGTFAASAGDAAADGASATFTGAGLFSANAGDAAAAGGSTSFTGAAVFAATAGDAAADGGTVTFSAGGVAGTFTALAGDAAADGGSASFTATALFAATAGDASAAGGSASFTGAAVLAATAGDASADGATATFTGAALFTATAGDAAADGGSATFIGGSASTFVALAGDAIAAGGTAAFTAPGTFTALAGAATADGGTAVFVVATTFTANTGDAAASGGSSAFTGAAIFAATTGAATAGGGTVMFIAGEIPAVLESIGTHREHSHLGTTGGGHLGTHRETAT